MAIDRDVLVGMRPRPDGRVIARSLDLDGTVDVAADGTTDPASVTPAWGRTVAAVLRVLAGAGRAPDGFDAVIASNVPIGSGLSSSAAFGVAFALACAQAGDLLIAGRDARARRAGSRARRERRAVRGHGPDGVGVRPRRPRARSSTAARSTSSRSRSPDEVELLVVHSGLPRRLEDSAYADRRARV